MADLRVLIVDDEPLARQGLRGYLDDESGVTVIGECGSGAEAVAVIRKDAPDVVFLDVQMPGLDGFGVLAELVGGWVPIVVFVTAYDDYALRAFEVNAVDYLLKPYDRARFRSALGRARHRVASDRGEPGSVLASLLASVGTGGRYTARFLVRTGGRVYFVPVGDVDWIEAADNYVRLHVGGRMHSLRETLAHLSDILDPTGFVRVHRSAIVQIDRIRELRPLPSGDGVLVLRDGTTVPLSRGYRDEFRQRVGRIG